MYAIITDKKLAALTKCQDKALSTLNTTPNATIHIVNSLNELSALLNSEPYFEEDVLSNSLKNLVKKLENIGVDDELTNKILDKSNKLVGEAKTIGVKGMKVVGEGFIALGDLLRKSAESKTACNNNKD